MFSLPPEKFFFVKPSTIIIQIIDHRNKLFLCDVQDMLYIGHAEILNPCPRDAGLVLGRTDPGPGTGPRDLIAESADYTESLSKAVQLIMGKISS
jgi:hypothetical protein